MRLLSLGETLPNVMKVMRLLETRDKFLFWLLAATRYIVGLLDLFGIGLIALAVNFLIADLSAGGGLTKIFTFFGIGLDARGSKLPALFIIGLVAVGVFVTKAALSVYLLFKSANQVSRLEIEHAARWMDQLTDSKGRFNARALKGEISYAVTSGASSLFQRTLVPFAAIVSEGATLITSVVILFVIQAPMTIGVVAYFATIGLVLQRFVGRQSGINSMQFTTAHIDSIRTVDETVENENLLFLSGRRQSFVKRFADQRAIASRSQASTSVLSNIPRHVIETSMIFGAFLLAAAAFFYQEPLEAATTLTFFLTSATRMTPSLLNIMSGTSLIRGADADIKKTEELLSRIDFDLGGGKN